MQIGCGITVVNFNFSQAKIDLLLVHFYPDTSKLTAVFQSCCTVRLLLGLNMKYRLQN